MEKIILKIEKNHRQSYGWEDSDTCNCILNVGSDLEGRSVETHGEVNKELKRLALDGFIKKIDIIKFRKSIGQFDSDNGKKIDLNRIVKLAKILGIQVKIYELDESGKRHINPEVVIN